MLALVQVFACDAAMAGTLGIVTSRLGPGYNETIEALRNELSRVPGLKVQVLDASAEPVAQRLSDDVFMVVTVGAQAARLVMQTPDWRGTTLGVLLPKAAYETLPAAERNQPRFSVIFMDQPMQRQINLISTLLPAVRTVGIVLGPNTEKELETYRNLAVARGLAIVSERVSRDSELYPALKSLLPTADVFLAVPDPAVVNTATAQNLLLTAFRQQVPVFGYSAAYVRAGALAAVHTTPQQFGAEAAAAVRHVMRGGSLPGSRYPRRFSVSINRSLAERLGESMPEESVVVRRLQSLEPAD